jgi:ubiquinone/menaquinone biosynthesis C-methylase UbiE
MHQNIARWEKRDGPVFLRKVGLKPGQKILDFGCRVGHYTVPAATVAGKEGLVYAVDKEQYALSELKRKAAACNLNNIRLMKTSGQMRLALKDESVDVVLLYDVLHYSRKNERTELYKEIFRVLEQGGLLSVYPKHTAQDAPLMELQHLNVSDIRQEIQNSGFRLDGKYYGVISHDDGLNKGCILNFRKPKNENNNSL